MTDATIPSKEADDVDGVKMFASPAFLKPLEKGLFGLFRNIEVEYRDKTDNHGERVREKLKTIGPIKVLRVAQPGEEQLIRLRTVHPDTGDLLELVEVG